MKDTQEPQEQMDEEQSESLQRLRKIRKKLRSYVEILDKATSSELEKVLTSEDDFPAWTLNSKTISEAEELLRQASLEYERSCKAIQDEWTTMAQKFAIMGDEMDLSLMYSIAHPKIKKVIKECHRAIDERIADKFARTQAFETAITELRNELKSVWEASHANEEDKAHFMSRFTSQNFSDDLYEAHQAELQVWRRYQEKNRALMDKLARRQQMWNEMIELESKADDPTRFVNRGASLLKDQSNLVSIRKNLPKIEEDLLKLATKFSIDHGRVFKIHGKEIGTLIQEDWAKFREDKGKKKFERNIPVANGPAPSSAIGLTPSRKRVAVPSSTPSVPYKK